MGRKVKNILMLLLVVILIGTISFTIYSEISNNNEVISMGSEMQGGEAPGGDAPDMPDGEMSDEDGEPPELPDGESAEGENSETPSQDGQGEMDGNEPPEMNGSNDMGTEPNGMDNNQVSSTLSLTAYALLIGQSLALSLIIIYLIMSRFNKKNFKETFKSSDKVIIYLLSTIILTAACTIGENYIINHLDNSSAEPTEMDTDSEIVYSAVTEITEDTEITSGEYTSENEDEIAILVTGDIDVSLENISVTKTGDSDGGDNTSFYGINSAILAKDGATLTIDGITVTTNAVGANGVFSYGGSATTNNTSSDGTTVNISNSTITTTKDNSGGIMTTGGGIMNATNLTVTTSGISSAAIRTDRGGGTVSVSGGTYTTNGAGSPAVYSTASVTVSGAELISKVAEGIVIEGKNSVTINSCTLTDSNTELNGLSTTYKNIFLYQSMSGDAAEGDSEFTATDSTIITNNGDTFYITNTTAIINLENNAIANTSDGNFLRAQADSWGNDGENGGIVTLNLTNQDVEGNIVIDSISTLDMTMSDDSYYEGTINGDNEAEEINLTLDASSSIKLTGDSYITSLDNADTTNSNIDFNGYKLYVNGTAIN